MFKFLLLWKQLLQVGLRRPPEDIHLMAWKSWKQRTTKKFLPSTKLHENNSMCPPIKKKKKRENIGFQKLFEEQNRSSYSSEFPNVEKRFSIRRLKCLIHPEREGFSPDNIPWPPWIKSVRSWEEPVPNDKQAWGAREELLMLYVFWVTVMTKNFLLLLFNHFNFLFTTVSFLPCSAEARTLNAGPWWSVSTTQKQIRNLFVLSV